MKKAHIETKWLRKIKLHRVPIITTEGDRESKTYTEISGAILIPLTDAHLFNTSRSAVQKNFREGNLIPYHANGQVKRGNSSKRTFFDLNQYLDMDRNEV